MSKEVITYINENLYGIWFLIPIKKALPLLWRDDYLSVFHRSNYTIELSTKNGANSCVRETENNK